MGDIRNGGNSSMKKLLAILLVLCLCVGLTACALKQTTETATTTTETAPAKIKIGILAPAVTHGWVAGVAYQAEQRCIELADTVEYKVATSNNAEEMTAQLDDLKTWGADAIVAFPQWEGMEVPVQAAIDEGIKFVNFDIDIKCTGIYKVTGDNEGMGTKGAEYIVSKIGTTGTVVALPVPSAASVNELRMKGFKEKMAEIAPDVTILEYALPSFSAEDGHTNFADILLANPQIDAVFSLDDESSIGVLKAIEEAGRTDIKAITGGGGAQKYFAMMPENENIWIASALYSPLMMKDAVDMAVKLAKGETVEETVVVIPTTIVDRSNAADYIDPNNTVY